MKKVALLSVVMLCCCFIGKASADPGPYDPYFSTDPCDSGSGTSVITPCETTGEINVIDTVNYLLANASVVSPFTSNTDLDSVAVNTPSSYWLNNGDASLAFISISAGGFNVPGVYEYGNPASPVYFSTGGTGGLFFGDGSSFDPYPGMINPYTNSAFGIVISHDGSDSWYSDPALNSDAYDHMLAFDLSSYLDGSSVWLDLDNDGIADQEVVLNSTFLLAFEDITLPDSDHDFNDSIYLISHVTPVNPVPEPKTSLLFLAGFAGLVCVRRKGIA